MSDESLRLGMDLVARDEASPAINAVRASLDELRKSALAIGRTIKRSLNTEFVQAMSAATSAATKLGTDTTASLNRIATSIRADTAAMDAFVVSVRAAAAAQRDLSRGTGRGGRGGGGRPPVPPTGIPDLREIRRRWSLRERSARAEVSEIQASAKAEAVRQKAVLDGVARQWRMKQASERSELRHLATVRREQTAMRREMHRSAHEALRHGERAVRSINHPAHESIGRALTVGAAVGTAGAVESVRHDESLDSWLTQYRITTKQSLAEIRSVRREALHEANQLGVDPAEIIRLRVQSVRDGLKPELARIMPKLSAMAAQAMGGSIEEDGEELSRAVKDAQVVGWVSDQKSARSTMNSIVGLSTFEGNSPLKMKQALANGLISRGKEVGWNQSETFAAATALNSSGERTGTATARLFAQIPMIRAGLFDRWRKATRNPNTEENRAMIGAPRALGYSGIRGMEAAFSSPDKLFDLLYRLGKLPEKQKALIEKGFGLDEQFNPIIAEAGADHGKKYRDAKRKADELSGQDESNDELEQAWTATRSSLSNILGRIKQGWVTLSDEVGDTIKTDILSPLSTWWGEISDSILDGDLGAKSHAALKAFIEGLGFRDFADMLHAISGSARGLDAAEFFRGIGEGIRSVADTFRSVTGLFGFMGGGSARTIGRIAAELLGLSVALRVISPIVTLIGGVAEGIRAIGAAASTIRLLSGLGGIAGAAGEGGLLAAALTTMPITLAAIAAGLTLSVVVMNWQEIKEWLFGSKDKPDATPSASVIGGEIRSDVLKSVPPAFRNDPSKWSKYLSPSQIESMRFGPEMLKGYQAPTSESDAYWSKKNRYLHPSSYEGGDGQSWRDLLTPASYTSADSGEVTRGAIVDTARSAEQIRDGIDRVADLLRRASDNPLAGAGGDGEGGGGGGFGSGAGRPNIRFGHHGAALGSALPNMRYGHGGGGQYRTTPGGGQAREIGPKVSLGKMGAKFAAKAPTIMDGLKKKYGLTDEQAAGILGNLGHESAGFTAYHEGGQAPGKGGVGWAQWTGPRRRQFEKWVAAHGLNPTSDEASWRYLTEGDPETAGAIAAVKGQSTVEGSLRAFHDHFERSADISHGQIVKPKSWRSRQSFAAKALALSKQHPGGATVEAEKPSPAAKPTAESEGTRAAKRFIGTTRPKSDDVRPANNVTADNSSSGHTYNFHIHGASDAHHVARTVQAMLDKRNNAYHDQHESV